MKDVQLDNEPETQIRRTRDAADEGLRFSLGQKS